MTKLLMLQIVITKLQRVIFINGEKTTLINIMNIIGNITL